jgi:hypothetical protein
MMSVVPSNCRPSKPSAATPITVAGTALTLIASPMPGPFPKSAGGTLADHDDRVV